LKRSASKHRGVSYRRSAQLIEELELEVKELLLKAERADSQGETDPTKLPEQMAKRQELKAKLEAARQQLEERQRKELETEVAEYQKRKQAWENNGRRGQPPRAPVCGGPKAEDQTNLSDSDSRIMRKSKNVAFVQGYNAQVAVDATGSQLILGAYVTQSSADNKELEPMLETGKSNSAQKPQAVLADRGYLKGPSIEKIQGQGMEAYVALRAEAHERRRYDLRCQEKRSEKPLEFKGPILLEIEHFNELLRAAEL
jgi:hypothetical protein